MINDAFDRMGLAHYYQRFDVPADRLKEAVDGMKALGVSGFNVTVPHKVAVMPHLDAVDEEAKSIGAVNTVINDNGTFIGRNTDGRGYLLALQEAVGGNLSHKNILMIGAGGAARGVAVTLDRFGIRCLDITNRTMEKANTLITNGIRYSPTRAITSSEAIDHMHHYDIIINTTSVGMSPHTKEMPLSVDHISSGVMLSDLIYNPLETKWLAEGKKQGAITMNGLDMFINQGALAFENVDGRFSKPGTYERNRVGSNEK